MPSSQVNKICWKRKLISRSVVYHFINFFFKFAGYITANIEMMYLKQ
jgi:hypothetical protein